MSGSDGGEWAASPGVAPSSVTDGGAAFRLEVDGEDFELQPDGFGGTHYNWISGPNPGYGFSTSPSLGSLEQHRANIRNFLSMVDRTTGYIEDE
ncbi:hypothetical protein [Kribbella sindirgiensis]|uniref:Uncharacterized protein n=1 Tax=Kribbella sindirgiensis TaxID=1124744 RepID=A0A4R0I5E2_9ACTN|nr:hypothetical protein [Kribbella sindirgiensis]TCC22428.1 hypothetical protein E0H50_35265 [Kribbella sindirgiensis]